MVAGAPRWLPASPVRAAASFGSAVGDLGRGRAHGGLAVDFFECYNG